MQVDDDARHVVSADAARSLRVFSDAVVQDGLRDVRELAVRGAHPLANKIDDLLVGHAVPDAIARQHHELVALDETVGGHVRLCCDDLLLPPEARVRFVL